MTHDIKTATSRKAIEAAVNATLRQKMDDITRDTFLGTSTFTDPAKVKPLGPLNVEAMIESCNNLIRDARRNQLTVVVRVPHYGPILETVTPEDGKRLEMSYHQASELHKEWPLRLSKIVSKFEAEFTPVSGFFPEPVFKTLPPPPWGFRMDSTPEKDDAEK